MIGPYLLLLAFAVAVAAPRVLAGAGWLYRSPRLGMAAWYAVLLAIATAVAGALVAVLAPWRAADAPVCVAWRWCVEAAGGAYGTAGRLTAYTIVAVAAVLGARVAVTIGRAGRAGARRRREQVETLDLAGRRSAELGVTLLDHPQPAAYVVAGRRRRVVVTTGALRALSGDELAAVLAHERAHAAGRHDLVVDVVRLLHRALPASTLLACARREMGRLVEMRADDVATRGHARMSLARALVAMAAPATVDPCADAAVLAATGGDALARLNRLLDPPRPLHRGHRWALAAALGLLAVTPLGLLVAAQVYPMLAMCPTVF